MNTFEFMAVKLNIDLQKTFIDLSSIEYCGQANFPNCFSFIDNLGRYFWFIFQNLYPGKYFIQRMFLFLRFLSS